jgi:hypothetical protein
MMIFRNVLAAWSVVMVVMSGSLSATTVVPADFAQMARESEVIVHGRVVAVDARLVGARRTIESVVTLEIVDPIKGATGEQTVFRVPGGRVGRYRRVMSGAPEFNRGDEVIVFLKGRAPSLPTPYGLSQGVYRVARRGAAATVSAPVLADGPVTRGDPSRRPLSPSAFASQVRALLSGGDGQNVRRAIPRSR